MHCCNASCSELLSSYRSKRQFTPQRAREIVLVLTWRGKFCLQLGPSSGRLPKLCSRLCRSWEARSPRIDIKARLSPTVSILILKHNQGGTVAYTYFIKIRSNDRTIGKLPPRKRL